MAQVIIKNTTPIGTTLKGIGEEKYITVLYEKMTTAMQESGSGSPQHLAAAQLYKTAKTKVAALKVSKANAAAGAGAGAASTASVKTVLLKSKLK